MIGASEKMSIESLGPTRTKAENKQRSPKTNPTQPESAMMAHTRAGSSRGSASPVVNQWSSNMNTNPKTTRARLMTPGEASRPARANATEETVKVSAVAIAVICWRMWKQGDVLADGDQITGFLEWPIAPIAYAMSVLAAITLVIVLVLIWRHLRGEDIAARPADTEI